MEQRPSEASPVYVGGHLPPGLYALSFRVTLFDGGTIDYEGLAEPPFALPSNVAISEITVEREGMSHAETQRLREALRLYGAPHSYSCEYDAYSRRSYSIEATVPLAALKEQGRVSVRPVFRTSPASRRKHRDKQDRYSARRKARVLLRRFCTREQWSEYARDKRLRVETERSVFVLTQTRSGGVQQIPKSRSGILLRHRARTWCIHTPYGFPVEDMILAQKLAIENDERAFLRSANPIIGHVGIGFLDGYEHHPGLAEPVTGYHVNVRADARPASNALTGLYDAAASLGELGRPVRVTIDGMMERMEGILGRVVRIGRPPAERGSCCENNRTHEANGSWCRRAFRRFFEPIVEEGRLSIEEALEAERANRSPVPVGSERRRE